MSTPMNDDIPGLMDYMLYVNNTITTTDLIVTTSDHPEEKMFQHTELLDKLEDFFPDVEIPIGNKFIPTDSKPISDKQYALDNSTCPYCMNRDTSCNESDYGATYVTLYIDCNDCSKRWYEKYKFESYGDT